jgi:GDP-L-fucose synthase
MKTLKKKTFRLNKNFWSTQCVFLTGSGGFLGSHVLDALRALKPEALIAPSSRECNLLNPTHVKRLLRQKNPTLIIHLAAVCGGIGANQKSPGRFFYDNAMMGIQLMENARLQGVQKFVQVGTVCAYPKFPPRIPFREEDLWIGYPEETNAPYGLAKKMLLVQAQAYRMQYGFDAIYLLPANLYGPRDHFDLENSHVIPALIRKIGEAQAQGLEELEVWGTGKPTREFLYVRDAVQGILLANITAMGNRSISGAASPSPFAS